jgi:type IV pilus assembly protein PilV
MLSCRLLPRRHIHNAVLHCKRRVGVQLGFSLVEVLVSVIVLSFGLLGMVRMQAAALQANKEARLQSTAVRMAREAADMMRGNDGAGGATSQSAASQYMGDFSGSLPAAPNNCFTGACAVANPANADRNLIAQWQLNEWLTRVYSDLPGARVVICYDSAPFDSSGLPRWACNQTGGVAIIKVGWTRSSTNRSASGSQALEKVLGTSGAAPLVVLPVTAGDNI